MTTPSPNPAADLAVLRTILEGTARETGVEFFGSLVRSLATALGVENAFVAEFADGNRRVRTLAFWTPSGFADNTEYDLEGTPCEDVFRDSGLCHHPTGVEARFPGGHAAGLESFLGVPLLDAAGEPMGHLAVCDSRPMPAEPRQLFIFRIFAARAAAELERLRAERRMRESERRYRELYENAPTGYVTIGLDGRLTNVNARVMDWLGQPGAKLLGRSWEEFVVDHGEARQDIRHWLEQVRAGQTVMGRELELRRENRQPLWIQVWVTPEYNATGQVVAGRSVWCDVTDRILAEQERARLRNQNLYLQEEIKSEHNFEEIVGQTPRIREVLDRVRSVAPTDTSVLITGESGTGKELIARAIHSLSRRHDKPLIKVNCAALPAGLVESELFGHEKGAFTGAIARRLGRFELADGGTLFLDEVGELPLETQAKLLRALQEREIERLGGATPIQVDVRIIAATNRDLLQACREKTFREDLYYRLNVFPLHLPPLRDRKEDLPLLVRYLLDKFTQRLGKPLEGVSERTMQRLIAYPWPGNIRELQNILERAVILETGMWLEIGHDVLPDAAPSFAMEAPPATTQIGADVSLETLERQHIEEVLERTNWVIEGPNGAAVVLGLHPNTLRSRLKRMGLKRRP